LLWQSLLSYNNKRGNIMELKSSEKRITELVKLL